MVAYPDTIPFRDTRWSRIVAKCHCSYGAPIFEKKAAAPDKKIGILKRVDFARVNGDASTWIRPVFGILIGAVLTVFAVVNGLGDLLHANIFGIPVLETLLVVIIIFGVVLAFKRAKNKRFQSKRYVLITLFFTSLAYGGWLWSEILYDQQVINSFVVLQHHLPTPKP